MSSNYKQPRWRETTRKFAERVLGSPDQDGKNGSLTSNRETHTHTQKVRNDRRQELEDSGAIPSVQLSSERKKDTLTAVDLILDEQEPCAFDDLIRGACSLADVRESSVVRYLKEETWSGGKYLVYERQGTKVIERSGRGGAA